MSSVLQTVCTVLTILSCGPKDVAISVPQTGAYVEDVGAANARLDSSSAERLINEYRVKNGLSRVKLDPTLMRVAQSQADAMAAQDLMSHDLLGGFKNRLRAGGYASAVAAENLAAGHRTLRAAFTGWRESPSHRENLLRKNVTQLGIAIARTPRGRYKVYWAMIVAAPNGRPKVVGMAASSAPTQEPAR